MAALMPQGKQQFFTAGGIPLVGGKVYTYAAGTTTPLATYTTAAASTPNANPVILDSRGEASIFFSAANYKIVVKDSLDSTIWTQDNLAGDPTTKLRTDLAASTGATLIGWIRSLTGAIATTIAKWLGWQPPSVFEFMTDAQIADVQTAAFTLDVRAAIQQAIDSSTKVLVIPAGTYRLTKGAAQTDEAGTNYACLTMRSNLHIRAEKGAIFKLADGQSSNGAPVNIAMFFSNSTLTDITFENLEIDMNGANNLINRNNFTFAPILFSGTPAGVAARGDRVRISNCTFKNTPGVTCIGMAQSNTASVTLGANWKVLNCLFHNNGLDSTDHSSIYGWADDVLIDGNTFKNDTQFNVVGGLVSYELHGANHRFTNNLVQNYYQGAWVASNYTSDCDNGLISGNTFSPISGVGIDFYRSTAPESTIRKIEISGNTIGLDDTATAIALKVGVQIAAFYKIEDVLICDNIVSKVGTTKASSMFSCTPQTVASQAHDKIVVRNNHSLRTVFGAYLTTNATNGLGSIVIEDNTWAELTPSTVFTVSAGVSVAATSSIAYLSLDGNKCIDSRASPLGQYGEYLNGIIGILSTSVPANYGLTIADHTEAGLTVTTRRGNHSNISYVPVWNAPTAITLGDGTITGNYTVDKKSYTFTTILTVGSTTTFPGGNISVSLPKAATTSASSYFGTCRIFDSSAGLFRFGVAEIDSTGTLATLQIDGGTFITSGAPVALATGDIVSVQITYFVD